MKDHIRLPFNRVLALLLPIALVLALVVVAVPLQASVSGQARSSHTVGGSANVLGSPASQGTVVRAWDGNRQLAETTVDSSGNYILSVPVNTSNLGQMITFTVGDQISDGAIQLAGGGIDEVNLDAEGCGRALPRQGTTGVVVATGTVEDFLVSACQLQISTSYYAKYYYFVLDRTAEITVSMDSSAFNDHLYLHSGVGRHGPRIASSGDDIVRTLGAGTYTIAATSFSRTPGPFTLKVTGLPRVTGAPTAPPPLTGPSHTVGGSANVLGSPASQGTVVRAWDGNRQLAETTVDSSGNYILSVPVNTSTVGQRIQFTVGDQISDGAIQLAGGGIDEVNLDAEGCGRALPRQGTTGVVVATGTVEDFLVSACQLQISTSYYAKYYYFVLDRTAEITVSMDSSAFNDHLYLHSGVGRHGPRIASSGDDIVRTLGAGTYTIAATSFSRTPGPFTLKVTGLPRVTGAPTAPPPLTGPSHTVGGSANVLGSPASQGTLVRAWDGNGQLAETTVDSSGNYILSVPVNTSTVGQRIQFTVGDQISDGAIQLAGGGIDEVNLDAEGCGRALPRQGTTGVPGTTGTVEDSLVSACQLQISTSYYAKYYYFVLDRTAEITVSMDSSAFNDHLYLHSGVGRHGPGIASSGDDMVRTLGAGTYTIAATSFSRTPGPFTLKVTGLPRPRPPLPGPSAIVSVSAGAGSLTVSWSAPSGDVSGITAYDLRHIRTDADETVDANWTVVDGAWTTGSGPLRHTLTGLDDVVQYDVQVRAVNAVGRGPWSATATGATTTTTEPGDNQPPVFTVLRSIPEDATEGHPVGAPFAATDPDGDAVSYALSGADSGSFAVDRTSGQITLAAGVALDRAAKASYAVTVTATGGGGLSASIAVSINVAKADEAGTPRQPSSDCVSGVAVDGGALAGSWANDCPSVNQEGSYARYYAFVLSEEAEVSITLESDDADTYLFLLEDVGTSGAVLHKDDDYPGGGTDSQVKETLAAGVYTIEATTYNEGTTGGFTLSVETVEEPEQPAPPDPGPEQPAPPDPVPEPEPEPTPDTGCAGTVAEDGSLNGEWSSDCPSENRPGSYARYYSFTLTQRSEVTITLEGTSGDADTYLNLLSGAGTDGSVLHFNDDDGGITRSRIQETLGAGTYTVEATTYGAEQTGSFTLTVSGL